MKYLSLGIVLFPILFCSLSCKESTLRIIPEQYTYKISGEDSLSAYVFTPAEIKIDRFLEDLGFCNRI
ncbi:MAG TPA: hypothetical protein DEQ09_03015 [Bacteroidales bacterium]|nr:hypothetical protein [Bacteroidales bacterium]